MRHQFWLVEPADAGEMVPVPEVLPVPLTKPWYVGVTNIRGSLYSVVDSSSFTGAEGVTRRQENRLVLVGARSASIPRAGDAHARPAQSA